MYDDPINMKFDVAAFRAEAKISSLTTTIINKFGDLLCAKIDAGTKRACRINAGGVCLCRAIAVEALRAVAPAQADQSDAGRDAVIEEWNKLAHDFVCHAVNSWQWLSNAHTGIAKPGAADVISVHNDLHSLMDRWVELRQRGTPFDRALASAPSETVGRGEDKSYPPSDMDILAAQRDQALEGLKKQAARIRELEKFAFSTADRDAIREALKTMIRKFENCARHAGNEQFAIDAATEDARAALALLGEG